jgi:replicative DNA helicase
MSAAAPVVATTDAERERLRAEILNETARWVNAHADAARGAHEVRYAIARRVVSDLGEVLLFGRAVLDREKSADTESIAWILLRAPLERAGMAGALSGMWAGARRSTLRACGSKAALADMRDGASSYRDTLELVERIYQGRESEVALPTGLRSLDEVLNGGLPCGEMSLLAGITGGGKTLLALQIAENVSTLERGAVLVCSPEMQARDLWMRLAQRRANVARYDLRPSAPRHEEALTAMDAALGHYREQTGLVLLDRVDADVEAAIEAAQLMHHGRGGPLALVVLDYAQQLASQGKGDTPRYLEVARVASQALQLAADTGAAVLVTSQVNSIRGKGGDVIDVSIRESASLEHKAAVSMLLTLKRDEGRAVIALRKNRHGALHRLEFFYHPSTYLIAEIAREEDRRWS